MSDMQTTTDDLTSVSLVLNRGKLDELRQKHNIKTNSELAQRIGIDTATLWRLSNGKSNPSNSVIARMILAFPKAKLTDLFVIEREDAA